MFKLTSFIWFTVNSTRYMQGERLRMILGFRQAWRDFYRLVDEDRKRG